MNKAISIALLTAGIVLMVYGVNASNSLSSGVSRLLTGSPTNKTVWLMVGGLILEIVGVFSLFGKSEKN